MMDSFASTFRHPILISGQIAASTIREPARACVEAVFCSTFYIKSREQLICLGHRDMEPGPLNCITTAPASTDWRASGLKCGTKVHFSPNAIRVGNQFQFPLAGSKTWNPAPGSLPDVLALERAITDFRHAVSRRSDVDGFGRFLTLGYQPGPGEHTCLRAEGPIFASGQWLEKAFLTSDADQIDVPNWAEKLSGLGPGLTPSGDDFLGGMMIALHGLGRFDLSEILWRRIKKCATENCNPISWSHLSAASTGLGCDPVHRALAAISIGNADGIATAVGDISKTGHSSGWDIMTGIITTLEAWLSAQTLVRRI